ncbi:MAG: serine hydrolase [Spirochaetales bacterium]|nr:serine hydrolase [Spirochaetales bacterium]
MSIDVFRRGFSSLLFIVLISSCTSFGVKMHTSPSEDFSYNIVACSGNGYSEFPTEYIDLGKSYVVDGKEYSVKDFFKKTNTTSFLVLRDGVLVYEKYFLGTDRETLFLSNSMVKSVTSTLVGLAVEDNLIDSIEDPIIKYLPELKDSGYGSVTIKNLLQMTSGVKYNEGGGLPRANLFELLSYAKRRASLNFLQEMRVDYMPGTSFRYASVDTLVLGHLIGRVTGISCSQYLSERIWTKIGAEADAYWSTDAVGQELAFGFFYARARDYLRFGQLAANMGRVGDSQIVSTQWLSQATLPRQGDGPENLLPGNADDKDKEDWGYQYQWWSNPDSQDKSFYAIGVFGQYMYINPETRTVVLRTSFDLDASSQTNYTQLVQFMEYVADYVNEKGR